MNDLTLKVDTKNSNNVVFQSWIKDITSYIIKNCLNKIMNDIEYAIKQVFRGF